MVGSIRRVGCGFLPDSATGEADNALHLEPAKLRRTESGAGGRVSSRAVDDRKCGSEHQRERDESATRIEREASVSLSSCCFTLLRPSSAPAASGKKDRSSTTGSLDLLCYLC